MEELGFRDADYLAWNRFMLVNIAALSIAYARERDGGTDDFLAYLRERLGKAWRGLGAQGVEGAMLSSRLTVEALGSGITSSQVSPENSELIVEDIPGQGVFDGLGDRFDVELDIESWYELLGVDRETANSVYDIISSIAEGAGIEYQRSETDEGGVRLILRAW